MAANTRNNRRQRAKSQRGFSLMQLLITLAVVSVICTLAILGIASARQRIRLTNSARLLASYVEKARVDSVRRHPMAAVDMAGVQVLNTNTYRVKMDFDANGTVETRDVTLDSGVVFATDPIALAFDWRGRLVDLPLTEIKVSIAMQWGNDPNDQRVVDITRSGDVTIDSDVYLDDVPNVNVNVGGLTGIDSGSTVNGNNNPDPSPTPTAVPEATPTPTATPVPDPTPPQVNPSPSPIADPTPTPTPSPSPGAGASPTPSVNPSPSPVPTPTPCTVTVTTSPNPLRIPKRGSGTISFAVNPSGPVVYNRSGAPSNLAVTQTTGNNFTVTSLNNTRGNFTLVFTTPCGSKSVSISVTN